MYCFLEMGTRKRKECNRYSQHNQTLIMKETHTLNDISFYYNEKMQNRKNINTFGPVASPLAGDGKKNEPHRQQKPIVIITSHASKLH